ncbi:hypothetical protein [Nocardia beijingensis]|uniref:hypothetical protein n=1 Tax=Nocardia beijingensis TaxID=95162 RepID=UPI0008305E30|nr:hypothetical protein [Nocardia beijingensis]
MITERRRYRPPGPVRGEPASAPSEMAFRWSSRADGLLREHRSRIAAAAVTAVCAVLAALVCYRARVLAAR